jgi:apolipoprotein N-acyltransferase
MLHVAGIQLEFPGPPEVLVALDHCLNANPAAELFVLSEYSFDGPVSERVKRWCREHGKWLIAGGKEPLGETNYFNTAFVVSTNGEVVFRQAKSVPLQFFADGRPAPSQRVWDSPWGPIGILICYDVSYSRVGDELIRQGARTLIAPALDAEAWGAGQHRQNARMTLLRALEYGVPIFRVAGSGISQLVSRGGELLASAPFPGQGEMLSGELRWHDAPSALPLDRWLTRPCVVVTALSMVTLMTSRWRVRRPQSSNSPALTTA